MDSLTLLHLLEQVQAGRLPPADALEKLRLLPFEDLGFAKVDHHRELRKGFPEVVFGPGKTPEQIAAIVEGIVRHSGRVLVTRVDPTVSEAVQARVPALRYHAIARALYLDPDPEAPRKPGVAVLCAGTADLPVAEEAALTAELLGNQVARYPDVGIAGVHRLLAELEGIQKARAIVVVAGMEGALPSLVGGLVAAPVIAVPTSVGYGTSFGGLAALLAMLNSCAPGVAVVNIDNGFGAGFLAGLINRLD
ncbi:MAG: nickel pincer cofactor biosynthesis protein LarB [Chloroflexi bacterium]|nr:nickel pincer cofactor biosynthesis protein LarB [Chloroflexota bacterium]